MRSRPVKPRARRMQDIVASVPLLTMRTFSMDGTHSEIIRAISISAGLGMPKLTPRAAAVADRLAHHLRRMPEDRRSPGADVIDELVAIDIPDVRPFRALDKERLAADAAKSAHGRIYPAGDEAAGLGESGSGARTMHGGGKVRSLARHGAFDRAVPSGVQLGE